MTIRIEQLSIQPDASAWLTDQHNVIRVPAMRRYMLSMVRHIMRERGDCTKIPVVVACYARENLNEWGHNFFVEVSYTDQWRAIYAANLTREGITNFQCYMD